MGGWGRKRWKRAEERCSGKRWGGGGRDGRGQGKGVVERDGGVGRDGRGQRKGVVERDGGGRDGRGQRKGVVERDGGGGGKRWKRAEERCSGKRWGGEEMEEGRGEV